MFSCLNVTGQAVFDVRDLSPKFDVRIEVAEQKIGSWQGNASFEIFKKGSSRPLQVIRLNDTFIFVDNDGRPTFTNISAKSDGKWSSLYLEDFNFDGFEDLAIPDGSNGGYGGTSYRVYLWSKRSQQFHFSKPFTRLAQGPYIGIPEPDKNKRTLTVASKSGCCMHFQEKYRLANGKPRLVEEIATYLEPPSYQGYEITITKKIVNGRWRTWSKKKKIS